jgi:hypothetical protein
MISVPRFSRRVLQTALMIVVPLFGGYPAHGQQAKRLSTQVAPQLFVLREDVVEQQWRSTLSLVNVPSDVETLSPGECIRFAVIATGDQRDEALAKSTFSFELTTEGKTQVIPLQQTVAIKQIKPEGGDFVTQMLGVIDIKNPIRSMASMAVPEARWCAPTASVDGTLTVVPRITVGKNVVTATRKLRIKSFGTARKTREFSDLATFSPWLQRYHYSPDPAHLLTGLRIVAADERARGTYNFMSFFVAAWKKSPAAREDVLQHLQEEAVQTRVYAIPLLRLAGAETSDLFAKLNDSEKAQVNSYSAPDSSSLFPDPMLPTKMDMLWAQFFATGDIEPVQKIASMLEWGADYDAFIKLRDSGQKIELTERIMRGVSYAAAGWSLAALSRSDGLVADYIEAIRESPSTKATVRAEIAKLHTNPAFTKR